MRLLQLENQSHKWRYLSRTSVGTPRRQVIATWDNLGHIPALRLHDHSRQPCRIFSTGELKNCLLGTSFHTGECNCIKSISGGVGVGLGLGVGGGGMGHRRMDGTELLCPARQTSGRGLLQDLVELCLLTPSVDACKNLHTRLS